MSRVARFGLSVAPELARFVEEEALPGSGVTADSFWQGFAGLVAEMTPRNRALLDERARLQQEIDAWHVSRRGQPHDPAAYRAHLEAIGYLLPDPGAISIATERLDPEIATTPGPQLVVPVTNARYALNAANARWGSLYDALYGTDALGDAPAPGPYDPARGARVVAWGRAFLDDVAPLQGMSWAQVTGLLVLDGALVAQGPAGTAGLASGAAAFAGHVGAVEAPATIALRRNGLHILVDIDPATRVGRDDRAGISDIRLESALSAIIDCEDSVACVDAEDKVLAYRNWLGLMKGDLSESFEKGGQTLTRKLASDIALTAPDGTPMALRGRALMLVRNVGHLMTTPAVHDDAGGEEVFEGLLDAAVTVLCAVHDLNGARANSPAGSVYVVKPKMHGPAEVAFADEIFARVEDMLDLPRHTVKLGIMDEERRTSVNLKACIGAARHRVAFINTGFLDRTGDEIHTAMEAGPMLPKGEMKSTPWIAAYEAGNVETGLACGLAGRAQIGKGMWAMPDRMAEMLATKGAHPEAGATCAWVPSPTAATLHATHYHRIDVRARQNEIAAQPPVDRLDDLLALPLLAGRNLAPETIAREVENNCQGILGYVVRWVDQGIGCSKVPDIDDVGLMEDRATCRISAQALANWLHHEVVSEAEVMACLRKMAVVVDRQNEGDPAYRPMAPRFDGLAFQAACDLVFAGREQPSGYTEPVLHRRRLQFKEKTHGRTHAA